MNLLPKWIMTKTLPAYMDCESATALEQTYKVYKAMNELIDEYNEFATSTNKKVEDFINTSEQDFEVFRQALRQEFQDFIDVSELKIQALEKDIQALEKDIQDTGLNIESINTELSTIKENITSLNECITELETSVESKGNKLYKHCLYITIHDNGITTPYCIDLITNFNTTITTDNIFNLLLPLYPSISNYGIHSIFEKNEILYVDVGTKYTLSIYYTSIYITNGIYPGSSTKNITIRCINKQIEQIGNEPSSNNEENITISPTGEISYTNDGVNITIDDYVVEL